MSPINIIPWVTFDAVESGAPPCTCCHHMSAWDDEGYWQCEKTGRRWLIVDAEPDLSQPHVAGFCDGNRCPYHPLITPELSQFYRASEGGISWGDIVQDEEDEARARETPAQKAAREAKAAREMRDIQLGAEAHRMQKEAEMVEFRSKMGLKRGEKPRKAAIPCKKLYSCCGDKSTGGAKPTTKHVSSECWAWEYTDPRDKKKKAPHTCPWIHPGEEGWHAEWMTDRNWKPPTGAAAVPTWRAPAAAAGGGWEPVQQGRRGGRR